MASSTEQTVRDQYESYPYPSRDPKDEKSRLIIGSPSHLDEINHFVFAGKRDFTQPFRALVAGGGTGDALIMLAQHLADAGAEQAEIIYLDLSTASREVAEARAAMRGLDHLITFKTGSLLDLEGLGPFDYIDCCGVLHHLPNPTEGFKSLAGALKPDGGIGLMVYGTLGRSGVYDGQAMMKILAGEADDGAGKVALTKKLLQSLPPTNHLRRNPLISDQFTSDAGIYDLLLHSTDRSYLVPELLQELEAADLRLISFIEPGRYDPALYIGDRDILSRLKDQPVSARASFAERLAGNMKKHILYCTHAANDEDTIARPGSPSMVPVFRDDAMRQKLKSAPPGAGFTGSLDGLEISKPLPPMASDILLLCDGKRTLDDIRKALPGSIDWFRFKPQFDAVYKIFGDFNLILLRHGAD